MSNASWTTLMEPLWFFLLFVIMWFGITAALAHMGGWASLASTFRATQPVTGKRFRFVSGSMGKGSLPVSYNSCLFVAISETGIHLSIFFPFRFQSPPLFIPWAQIESVVTERSFFSSYRVIRVHNHWPAISVRGKAGQFIDEAYTRVSSQIAPGDAPSVP